MQSLPYEEERPERCDRGPHYPLLAAHGSAIKWRPRPDLPAGLSIIPFGIWSVLASSMGRSPLWHCFAAGLAPQARRGPRMRPMHCLRSPLRFRPTACLPQRLRVLILFISRVSSLTLTRITAPDTLRSLFTIRQAASSSDRIPSKSDRFLLEP